MEIEHLTFTCYSDKLKDQLNAYSEQGWRLHTVLDWGDGMLYVIMEGAKDFGEEAEPEPMRMR